MKGIVVEKNSESSVLLLSDGTFRTVKTTDELQIGTVIYMNNEARSTAFYLKKAIPMVAAVFVMAFLGIGVYSWTIPVQYINIDINPSVELVINRYDRIIQFNPLNDDGEKLLKSVDLQLKKYEKGVNAVIESAKDLGYLEDEGDVLISVSSSNSELRQKTQAEIEEKVTQEAEVLIFDASEHERSVREGLSPGKSQIISKVMESGTNLTEEELAAAPVKDLMLRVKENRKMNLELEKETKQKEKQQKELEKADRKENDENGENRGKPDKDKQDRENQDKNNQGKSNQDNDINKSGDTGKEDGPKGNDKTNDGKKDDKTSNDKSRENSEGKNQQSNHGENKNNGDSESHRSNQEDKKNQGSPGGEEGNKPDNPDKPVNKSEKEQGDNREKSSQPDKKDTLDGNQPADKKNNKDNKDKADITDKKNNTDEKHNPSEKGSEDSNKNDNKSDNNKNKNDIDKSGNDSDGNGKSGGNSGQDGKSGGRG